MTNQIPAKLTTLPIIPVANASLSLSFPFLLDLVLLRPVVSLLAVLSTCILIDE